MRNMKLWLYAVLATPNAEANVNDRRVGLHNTNSRENNDRAIGGNRNFDKAQQTGLFAFKNIVVSTNNRRQY
jgi:hypothetical protein